MTMFKNAEIALYDLSHQRNFFYGLSLVDPASASHFCESSQLWSS